MKYYSTELKEAVVKEYLRGPLGGRALTRKYGLSSNTLVYNWVHAYQLLGKKGLVPDESPAKYTGEMKLAVLQFIETTGATLGEAAKTFHLPNPQLISKWQRKYKREGKAAFFKPLGRPKKIMPKQKRKQSVTPTTHQEVLAENERLRIENDYLKKLQLFQQSLEKKNDRFRPK